MPFKCTFYLDIDHLSPYDYGLCIPPIRRDEVWTMNNANPQLRQSSDDEEMYSDKNSVIDPEKLAMVK